MKVDLTWLTWNLNLFIIVILNQDVFMNISWSRCQIHAVFFCYVGHIKGYILKKKFIQIWSLDYEIIILNPLFIQIISKSKGRFYEYLTIQMSNSCSLFLLCSTHQELHFKKMFIQIWSLDHEIIILNPLYYTNNFKK